MCHCENHVGVCLFMRIDCVVLAFYFLQVMSHNKERRSKRDEKLDKKSQAMEELKAEREKKKNKTGARDWPLFMACFFCDKSIRSCS